MTMPPDLRKLALTAHVLFSVGWLGAVTGFLALALSGLTSQDTLKVRAAYIAMETVASFAIVPLCVTSLLSGIIQSLGTPWGLARHYWVLIKLLITAASTVLLLVHMRPVRSMAAVAAAPAFTIEDSRAERTQLVTDAAAAVLVLTAATALSVYKPPGRTPYGSRGRQEQETPTS